MRCPKCGYEMVEQWPVKGSESEWDYMRCCDHCFHVEDIPTHLVLEHEQYPRLPGL